MSDEIIAYINKNYILSIPPVWEKVKGGYLTDNFSIGKGKSRYFLKQYRFDDEKLLQELHQVKLFFSKSGIPVIMPIPDKNNNSFFLYQGKYYTLFPFVTGIIAGRGELTKKHLSSLVSMLAKIHLATKDNCPNIASREFHAWNKEKLYQDAANYLSIINKKPVKDEFDRAAVKHIKIKLELSKKVNIEYGDLNIKQNHILHGDFHEHNVFFNKAAEVTHVYDWEKARIGPRAQEIIRLIDLVALHYEFNEENYRQAKILFDEYQNNYPLSRQEYNDNLLLYFYKYFCTLWIPEAHYIKGNLRPDRFLINGLPGLEFYTNNFDTHLEKLRSLLK
ncbi:MAG: aminoglycoside phosphotransferase family protein [bacterium]|nr:aminoglycoside phosphotransferase family protein [bacterium]